MSFGTDDAKPSDHSAQDTPASTSWILKSEIVSKVLLSCALVLGIVNSPSWLVSNDPF